MSDDKDVGIDATGQEEAALKLAEKLRKEEPGDGQVDTLEQPQEEEAAESTVEDVEATESEDAPEEEKPKEKKSRSQRQRERHQAEVDALNQKLTEAEQRLGRIKSAQASEAEPKEDDFSDHLEYVAAKAVWKAGRANQASEEKAAARDVEAAQKAAQEAARVARAARIAELEATVPDIKEKIDSFVSDHRWEISQEVAQIVLGHPKSVEMLYHLATDDAAAAKLHRADPIKAAIEIGRMESRLVTSRPANATKAPPPIKPVQGRAVGGKDPKHMSFAEYKKAREAGKI